MTPKNQIKIFTTILSVLACCFAVAPLAEAKPGEDRGNGNSAAEHVDALDLLTTGSNNTAHGWFSLFSDTSGSSNTAAGFKALYSNTTGTANTAIGDFALFSNDSSGNGTANNNMAVGSGALNGNIDGSGNTAVGTEALFDNTVSDNTAVGFQALTNNTIGLHNTALGTFALTRNLAADDNTAIGFDALLQNDRYGDGFASDNTAVGSQALEDNFSGKTNTAVGSHALEHNIVDGNTAVGNDALGANVLGSGNTAVGTEAGAAIVANDGNVCIGAGVTGLATDSNTIRIASNFPVANGRCFIGGVADTVQPVTATALQVTVETAIGPNFRRLGHVASSRRYKEQIKPMDKLSETLFKLKPVTYRVKKEIDPAQAIGYGLIAEEVAEANPDLVARNPKGQPESVNHEAVNVMLLNEFLKEHKRVQGLKSTVVKQEATIARQQKQIDALTAGLQKVSAQLEVSTRSFRTIPRARA
jgi:uncharacterized coiled-coil protein SlyX